MKKNWKRMAILSVLFGLIILSIVQCNRQITQIHENQLVNQLRLVTQLNIKTMEAELRAQQTRVLSMAVEIGTTIDNGNSVDDIIGVLASMNQVAGFKRVGFVDAKGIAVTTDGYRNDLSFRDFYQRSMKGEFVITGTLTDVLGIAEPINVFSAPVYKADGTICGVVFASYRNEQFQSLFNLDSFESTGSNCIVDEESRVMVATKNLPFDPEEYTLWKYMESISPEEKANMEKYYRYETDRNQLYFRIDGGNDDDYYIYYEAMDMGEFNEKWYVVTMVTTDSFRAEVSNTMWAINAMLFEVGALVVMAFLLFTYDINRMEKKQRRELEQVAYVDPLTGGNNYAYFKEKVSRDDRIGYIVSMDIHAFKMINSVCGNEKGDEIISGIHQWIRESVSPEDLVAHVNSDRFVMFFPRLEKEAVIQKLTKINQKIIDETKKADVPQLSAYFGIAWFERGASVEKVFSDANFARDSIHDKKDIFYTFFDKYVTQHILEEKKIEDSFDLAIANHEFEVWYQPKFSPDTRKIVGAEALVRWRRPDGSLVSPGKFIPIFEGNGMIKPLDEYVFREVCLEQKKLMDNGVEIFPISVNLSRASLYSMNLVEHYKEITEEIGVDPTSVPIEITESAMVDDDSVRGLADEFYRTGFPLHMDDFGSGYSSLASLNRMHFDTLKLDKSLIDFIGNFGGDQLIKHTIALAKDLGMHVTAEGVEEESQVIFLQELRCDSIQGFYYSKPVPQEEFEKMF